MKLSDHFTLEEPTFSEKRRKGTASTTRRQKKSSEISKRLALLLEEIRSILGGKPIHVTSAYRSRKSTNWSVRNRLATVFLAWRVISFARLLGKRRAVVSELVA